MAKGKVIQYSDLVDPNAIPQLTTDIKGLDTVVRTLVADLAGIKKSLQNNPLTTGKGVKEFNTSIKKTVEITKDLTTLEKQKLSLDKKLSDARKTAATENAALSHTLSEQKRINKEDAKILNTKSSSMARLSIELAKNKRKYRELSEQQRNNTKVGGKLLKNIQAQDKQIKKLGKSLGDNQRNVGNYGSALEGVGGQFGVLSAIMPKIRAGLAFLKMGFTTLRGAIMATGIGALVVILGSLITYLTDTASGTSKLAQVMAPLKAILSTITSLAKQFGEAISLFVEGKWDEGFDLLKTAVSGVGDEYERQTMLQKRLANAEEQAFLMRKNSIVQIAKWREELEAARLTGKDETVAIEERMAAQEKAMALRDKIMQREIAIAALDFEIAKANSAMSEDSRDEALALEQAEANVFEKRSARNKELQRMVVYLTSLRNKYNASLKRTTENSIELAETLDTELLPVEERELELIEKRTGATYETGDATESATDKTNAALKSSTDVLKAVGEENKAVSLANATINAYLAGSQVLADKTLPTLAKIPAMIAIIAAGFKTVVGIAGVGFWDGTERVEGGVKGRDSVSATLAPDERVLSVAHNKPLLAMGISNSELPGMAALGVATNNSMPQLARLMGSQVAMQSRTNDILKSGLKTVLPDGSIVNWNNNKLNYN